MDHAPTSSWLDQLPSRVAFGFGATIGVGAVGILGFLVLLPGAIKGKTPEATAPTAVIADPAPAPTPALAPAPAPVRQANITVTDRDHIRGEKDARVTIVEWSDFQCSFCARFHPSVQRAMQEYAGEIRWVYRHFPLDSRHSEARPAAEASECAAEQGKFWEFADSIFERQSEFGPELYKSIAKELGVNESKFNECVTSGKYRQKVNDDEQAGLAVGIRGTPASFVNGVEVPGAVPYEQLKLYIDAALTK